MGEALNGMSEKQINFICSECDITKEILFSMDEDELYNVDFEKMCDIEIEEVCSDNEDGETERCGTASDIVTIMGNTLERLDDDE